MTLYHTHTMHMDDSAVAVYMGETNLAGICGNFCFKMCFLLSAILLLHILYSRNSVQRDCF